METICLRTNVLILLLTFLMGCAGSRQHSLGDNADRNTAIDNLKRAVQLPWKDDGSCVVREALNEWPVVVERCFYALDLQNIRFEASTGKCAFDAADTTALGKCLLAAVPPIETSLAIKRTQGPQLAGLALAPVLVAGPAVIVVGVIVLNPNIGPLIAEAIDDYLRSRPVKWADPDQTKPPTTVDVNPKPAPALQPSPKPQASPNDRLGPNFSPIPREWKPDPDDDRKKERPGRVYVTYTKLNKETKLYYSGRTSMVIDLNKSHLAQALEAMKRRDRNHHIEDENPEPKDPAFDGARLDKYDVGTAVNYDDRYQDLAYWRIRGREQQLIDNFGGAQSDTGEPHKTENPYRGVAKDHKLGWEFYTAATNKWGRYSEYTGD